MASPINNTVSYLPHERMSSTPPLSQSNSVSNDTKIFNFPGLPHEWYPQNKVIKKFGKECIIYTEATVSPYSPDPSIYVHFILKDQTRLRQFASEKDVLYSYDCPLIDKPFVRGYTIKASEVCPLKIKTDDHPVKREHMELFETQIDQFIKELLQYADGNININAAAFIEKDVMEDEAMTILKEMEGVGFTKDSGGEVECYYCAVCMEDVEMRWFQGMRLPCYHVFHVNCISCWFERKTQCLIYADNNAFELSTDFSCLLTYSYL